MIHKNAIILCPMGYKRLNKNDELLWPKCVFFGPIAKFLKHGHNIVGQGFCVSHNIVWWPLTIFFIYARGRL